MSNFDINLQFKESFNFGYSLRRFGTILTNFKLKPIHLYIGSSIVLFIQFGRYFKRMKKESIEKKTLLKKRDNNELSEWDSLRLRELSGDTIRTNDMYKLKAYHRLKSEWVKLGKPIKEFEPESKDIETYLQKDKHYQKYVEPPSDSTNVYDDMAGAYDDTISMDEILFLMKFKRKWIMSHCKGDVLEVSSGTGRNIDYMKSDNLTSYTFLDPSPKMMDIAQEKFKEKYKVSPNFKTNFTVGKAEDLLIMNEGTMKYDTIIETFGLCSHEDPVKALKNMMKLLKTGGRIVLLEHGRGTYRFINNMLDKDSHEHNKKWGCRWNLDIGELVDQSGLETTEERRYNFGCTWCIVAKKPEDPTEEEENNLFGKWIYKKTTNFNSSKKATL